MRITSWGAVAIAIAASGCAAADQQAQRATPPNIFDYGVFAYDDGRLMRLAPESEFAATSPAPWDQRTDFTNDVHLVVNDSELTIGDETQRVELWRMMEVKNAEYGTPERSGGMPTWISNQAQRIPVTFNTFPTTEMVEVVPRQPLAPGLYALLYDGSERTTMARFGVDWKEAEAVAFNSDYCVDRVTQGHVAYRPCPAAVTALSSSDAMGGGAATGTATAAALAPSGLALNLDDPVHQMVGGESVLLVSGEVANNTQDVTQIPAIQLSLKDSTGAVLRTWEVPTPQGQLRPGESARFSQSLRDLPPGAATVAAALSQ